MIKRSRNILTADFFPRKVVFHTTKHAAYILNSTAVLVWDFCAAPKREDEIASYLRRSYGIAASRAKKDVAKLVKELIEKKLLIKDSSS